MREPGLDPTDRNPLMHATAGPGPTSAPPRPPAAVPAGAGTGQLALLAAGVAAYALVSHLLMVHAANAPWAVAVLFGPLLLALTVAGWRRRHLGQLAACAALLALLVAVVWHGGVADLRRLYVLQHAGMHAALGLAFGLSLRAGSTPLITGLAQAVHGRLQQPFTPAMRHYTRGLTRAWTVYFGSMIGLSLGIYAAAPWPVWSIFGNLVTPLAAATFFLGEYALRYRLHPEFERLSMRHVIAAWRNP